MLPCKLQSTKHLSSSQIGRWAMSLVVAARVILWPTLVSSNREPRPNCRSINFLYMQACIPYSRVSGSKFQVVQPNRAYTSNLRTELLFTVQPNQFSRDQDNASTWSFFTVSRLNLTRTTLQQKTSRSSYCETGWECCIKE